MAEIEIEVWEITLRRGLNCCALGGPDRPGHFDNVRKSVCILIEKRQLYDFPNNFSPTPGQGNGSAAGGKLPDGALQSDSNL